MNRLRAGDSALGMTQEHRDWRAIARGNLEGLKTAEFKDEPNRAGLEKLRPELEQVPDWTPGRSMGACFKIQ